MVCLVHVLRASRSTIQLPCIRKMQLCLQPAELGSGPVQ